MAAPAFTLLDADIATLRRFGDALFREHYEEIARNKHVVQLDPDWPTYARLQAAGFLDVLLAFEGVVFDPLRGDEKLLGYSVLITTPLLHYRNQLDARNDVLFVTKSHRKTGLFDALFEATEHAARGRDAATLTWHAKQGTALDRIMQRRSDYAVQDILYSKVL